MGKILHWLFLSHLIVTPLKKKKITHTLLQKNKRLILILSLWYLQLGKTKTNFLRHSLCINSHHTQCPNDKIEYETKENICIYIFFLQLLHILKHF